MIGVKAKATYPATRRFRSTQPFTFLAWIWGYFVHICWHQAEMLRRGPSYQQLVMATQFSYDCNRVLAHSFLGSWRWGVFRTVCLFSRCDDSVVKVDRDHECDKHPNSQVRSIYNSLSYTQYIQLISGFPRNWYNLFPRGCFATRA